MSPFRKTRIGILLVSLSITLFTLLVWSYFLAWFVFNVDEVYNFEFLRDLLGCSYGRL